MLETLDAQTFTTLVLTGGLGWLLLRLGLRGGILDPRQATRRCAACARLLADGRPCRCRD